MSVYWGLYSVFGFVNFLLDLLHRLHRPHNSVLYQIVASTVVPLSIPPSLSLAPFRWGFPSKIQSKNYKRKQVDNMANSCAASTFQFSSVFLSVEEVERIAPPSLLFGFNRYVPSTVCFCCCCGIENRSWRCFVLSAFKAADNRLSLRLRSPGTCVKSCVEKQSKRHSRGICTHFAA